MVNAQIAWTVRDGVTRLILWGSNLTQAVYTGALAWKETGDSASYAPTRTFGFKVESRF